MEPILNSQLPEFSVQAFQNGAFKTVTNNDLKGKWAILFFYPADFTFVCPTELVDMAEKYDQFKAMGVEIYSVSTDSHFVHKAWHDASESIRKIQYPMLADPTGALCRALGVYIEEEGMAYRGTFVVNPEGKIKVVELNDNNNDDYEGPVTGDAAGLSFQKNRRRKRYMLESALKEQLKGIFAGLEANFTFDISVSSSHENRTELVELLGDVANCSDHITCVVNEGSGLKFALLKNGDRTGITFRGIPNGHEFTSLLLAILNLDGKGKNFPDEAVCNKVKALKGPIHLVTYVSLTCTNCPDVVQALNAMTTLNSSITHEMVDGALYQDEVDALKIQGVPSVFADGKLLHVGRGEFGELLAKLEEQYGIDETKAVAEVKEYDVIVAGGGPAGVSAAIYSARKGLRVAIVAERVGGQVKETVGIENLISVPETTGSELADNLKTHLLRYPVDLLEHRKIEKVEILGKQKLVTTSVGEKFLAPALIIATGASWRRLNVPGEAEYIGRGVAFCPHCDGPFYKGKHVAVVGGGNSGIEAAIDLAGICSKVTVFEFMDELKADNVLQERLKSLPNVEVFVCSQTTEVVGNGDKLTALRIKDRKTEEERLVELDGVFVQIGLSANSSAFREVVETNRPGEIVIDAHCRTNVTGIYAAGDVSTVPYKQIIISMGEGAKAALSAFDDRVRGVI